MTAADWTSVKENRHGEEVTDMHSTVFSARGAACVRPPARAVANPERALDSTV
ncbi:hypothetical protein VSH64_39935 [Amycolatopsis rhabdoformis]|uniref:DUF397 domain-containing protein n=1 Tax=Amycolatopsis rhabdoformis TaxID=1448059 RepID=A0ABZ1I3F8_9PSEU|nr:hypothetical protein [Amycolatopsis rhabdoformis]WSE28935.1 hypothetical protein VSH64_39935 [Amycolatopsis rhabdoformis]